jgi:phage shock protein C
VLIASPTARRPDELRRTGRATLASEAGWHIEEKSMALMRSRQNKMIAGVCGGLAKALGWSPGAVRVLYVLVSIVSVAFPGIIVYIILWLVMPLEP